MIRSARSIIVLGTLAAASTVAASAAHGQEIAYENAFVVDPDRRQIRPGTIMVAGGEIRAILTGPLPADYRGQRVDLGNRYVIPGLVDAHTHSFGNMAPVGVPQFVGTAVVTKLDLYAGVTAFLDLFNAEDAILGLRDQQRTQPEPGAWIFAAGPCLTATNGHCSEYGVPTRLVNSPAEADREVDALALKKPDVVKLVYDHQTYGGRTMPTVDRATMEAVIAAARRNGLKTVIHVGTWIDLREAVLAGATAVTHTPGPDPMPADIPRLMVERGTVHIPTLAVQSELARILESPDVLDDPLLIAVTTDALRAGYRAARDSLPPAFRGFVEWQRRLTDANRESVRVLAAVGVPMVTGTDGGNPGVFQGFSVHREMELLVGAGLTTWDALRAATTNAAALLDQKWGFDPGDEATFVVLDGSPITDIRNTRTIHTVVQRGSVVDRMQLIGR
ncbi:MAG: amidohydrolase family protein [Gemmatimonadetes bacterium]|nr:amidohydrolase family protein [Gemmatimonadota bacterium]